MQNKLQELTDKLYNEGLSKGKQEAESLLKSTKAQAEEILDSAKDEAKKIIDKAKKEAEELKVRVENDIKMASVQTFAAIKQQVETLIITQVISEPIKTSLSDKDFMKQIISSVINAFNAKEAEPVALNLILPEKMQKEFDSFAQDKIKDVVSKGIDIKFSKQLAGGFKIGPKDGGYMISFTDGDFERIIAEYLRPGTKKLLFG